MYKLHFDNFLINEHDDDDYVSEFTSYAKFHKNSAAQGLAGNFLRLQAKYSRLLKLDDMSCFNQHNAVQ